MNEKPSAWTPEEKSALFTAVEHCRANGGQLDGGAIAATVPGRSAPAVEVQYYKLQRSPHSRAHIPAPAAFPTPQLLPAVRACGAVARLTPWIESGIDLQFVQEAGSLGLGRSPPDPHPPRSRMRCDGFDVRSAP